MIKIKAKKGGRPTKRPSTEQLAILYENKTAREIAEQYDVSTSTVRGWVRKARREEKQENTRLLEENEKLKDEIRKLKEKMR